MHVEGTVEARALLYVPSKAPMDLFMREGERRGVQLYVKRVFIMDDWEALLPPWLRFVRGVVASDDLSLNVSREILQKDRQIQAIRKHLARRLLGALKEMKEQRAEKYRTFWPEFGAVLKEGLLGFEENQDRILDAGAGGVDRPRRAELTSLAEYVARMKDGQEAIYYMTAATRSAAERSPHLEAFRAKGFEVLFFTDPVDELWLRLSREFQGKKLVSVAAASATPEANDEEAKKDEEARKEQEEGLRGLLDTLRAKLQDHVKDVRLSSRLTESPACLVGDPGDISPHLRELLRRSGQEAPVAKRTLELNAAHPIVARLRDLHGADRNDPKLALYADLSVRPGAAGRGRAAARSGGLQPARRGADGDAGIAARRRAAERRALASEVVLAHVGVVEQLLSGALEAVAAELQDEAPVRDRQRLLGVLLDHQDGRALAVDGEDRVEHDLHHARVEAERRLVDHQQARMQQLGDGHLEDLLLAARQRAGGVTALAGQHREAGQQRLDVLAHARVAAQVGAHLEVLLHAHRRESCSVPAGRSRRRAAAPPSTAGRRSPRRRSGCVPWRGVTMPNTVRSSVDLPAPFAPMMQTISPARTVSVTPRSTSTSS